MGYLFGPLSGRVTEAAIAVHRQLGPGLLESINSPKLIIKRVVLGYQPPSAHNEG